MNITAFTPFLNSIDLDIKELSGVDNSKISNSIIQILVQMQENLRDKFSEVRSVEKHNVIIESREELLNYAYLNSTVNCAMDEINDIIQNRATEEDYIYNFVLCQLFLSYTIFLDGFTENAMFYTIARSFPYSYMLYYQSEKQARNASKVLKKNA
jgi:hypothetical protein